MSFEQPLTAAEAELERLLAIEPSIGFRARVRERVVSESLGARRRPWRLMLATASVLLAVAAAVLSDRTAGSRPLLLRGLAEPPVPPAPRLVLNDLHRPQAVPSLLTAPFPAGRAVPRQAAARAVGEPEMIWDAREAAAIARVVELARQRTVLTAPGAPGTSPMAVPPLFVAPISTELLVLPTGSERSSS
jgi:hypothetical protein